MFAFCLNVEVHFITLNSNKVIKSKQSSLRHCNLHIRFEKSSTFFRCHLLRTPRHATLVQYRLFEENKQVPQGTFVLIDRQIRKNNSFIHCLISLVSLRHLKSTWCLLLSNGKTKLGRAISERKRYSSRHLNNQSCYEATRSCTSKTRLEFH